MDIIIKFYSKENKYIIDFCIISDIIKKTFV